jgi:hypothetical protein
MASPSWRMGVSTGLDLPIGKFSETHIMGFTVNAILFKHSFKIPDSTMQKHLGFFIDAGIDYYLGLKETIGIIPYDYDEYTYVHLSPGLIYQAGKKTHLLLNLGPAISFYSGNAEVGFNTNLGGYYFFTEHFAVNPQFGILKVARADPLWNCSLRATWLF